MEIEISRIPDGEQPGSLRFSVTDTGIGVEDAECAEIFESFSQADSSLSREHTGVGLGLSICMKLARAMGGTCGGTCSPCSANPRPCSLLKTATLLQPHGFRKC